MDKYSSFKPETFRDLQNKSNSVSTVNINILSLSIKVLLTLNASAEQYTGFHMAGPWEHIHGADLFECITKLRKAQNIP